eukprot:Gb_05952 [translate_table: standard]
MRVPATALALEGQGALGKGRLPLTQGYLYLLITTPYFPSKPFSRTMGQSTRQILQDLHAAVAIHSSRNCSATSTQSLVSKNPRRLSSRVSEESGQRLGRERREKRRENDDDVDGGDSDVMDVGHAV